MHLVDEEDELFVLVDYDNVKINRERERNEDDMYDNLREIQEIIVESFPEFVNFQFLWYGGWKDEKGRFSKLGDFLLRVNHKVASRNIGKKRIKSRIANVHLMIDSRLQYELKGTVRKRENQFYQKMVDVVIALDAIFMSEKEYVVIVSNDDDLVPAVLTSAMLQRPIYLFREGEESRINDECLVNAGIDIRGNRNG